MNCSEARELIGADPDSVSIQLQAHVAACPECQVYQMKLRALNARIRQALEIDPHALQRTDRPDAIPLLGRAQSDRRRARARSLSIVTSLAAGLLVAFTLWLTRPSASLASEVVTHVEGEPGSWTRTESISNEQLEAVLSRSGVQLGPGMGPVVYASSCRFRGHLVPHLVVTTRAGPVTVMILAHEHVRGHESFREDGYSGLLIPARNGSVAILSRTPMALEPPAADVLRALDAANGSPAPAAR